MKSWILIALGLMLVIGGCEKKVTEPEEPANTELSESEQMEIIATEVASSSGGVMADVQVATASASGDYGALSKTTGLDTSITYGWITYQLKLDFYTKEGREQMLYVPDITDKIVYQSSLSGIYAPENSAREINLNRSSAFDLTNITSDTVTFNGTASNGSSYKFEINRASILTEAQSTYTLKNLVVDLNSSSYIPLDGRLEAAIKGKYSKDGLLTDTSIEYSINFVIEFSGGTQVKITLPSGTQFTLDLVSGEVS